MIASSVQSIKSISRRVCFVVMKLNERYSLTVKLFKSMPNKLTGRNGNDDEMQCGIGIKL